MAARGVFVVWLMMMGTAPFGVSLCPPARVPPVWRAQGQGWHWSRVTVTATGTALSWRWLQEGLAGLAAKTFVLTWLWEFIVFFSCVLSWCRPAAVPAPGLVMLSEEREAPMKSGTRIAGIWFL